ncbi:hypothetical protein D3C87_279950 [compost metagenome]
MHCAFCASVTEYESGWGTRPDGYVFALDKTMLLAKASEIHSRNSSLGGERVAIDNISVVVITPEFADQIFKAKGQAVWSDAKKGEMLGSLNEYKGSFKAPCQEAIPA